MAIFNSKLLNYQPINGDWWWLMVINGNYLFFNGFANSKMVIYWWFMDDLPIEHGDL